MRDRRLDPRIPVTRWPGAALDIVRVIVCAGGTVYLARIGLISGEAALAALAAVGTGAAVAGALRSSRPTDRDDKGS